MQASAVKRKRARFNSARAMFISKFGREIDEYDSVRRYLATLKNPEGVRKRLHRWFLFADMDPDCMIAARQVDLAAVDATACERFERLAKEYVNKLKATGEADYTVNTRLSDVRGFFTNNGRKLALVLDTGKMRLGKTKKTVKYSLAKDDVKRLVSVADCARDKFIVTVMWENGLAPADVAALRVGCLPDAPWVYYERSRQKTGTAWNGVSTPDICEALAAYMVVRGGKKGEPLLMGRQGPLTKGKDVTEIVMGVINRVPEFKAADGFVPYSLRDGFEDVLVDAQTSTKVKEAMMGHHQIQHQYGGKKRWMERCVDAMRRAYPLFCLSDLGARASASDGFSVEQVRQVKALLEGLDSGEFELRRVDKKPT